jgi:hypothetical protein
MHVSHRRRVGVGVVVLLLSLLARTTPSWGQASLIAGSRTVAGAFNYCVAGGTGNVLTCPLAPAMPAYVDGTCFLVRLPAANTGPVTLNVNGLGAKTLKKRVLGVSTDLASGELGAGQHVHACYDSADNVMQVFSLGGGAGGGGSGNVSSSGTPTAGQLASWLNATTIQGLTSLPASNFPALTGDVTVPVGSLTTTLANVPSGTPHAGSALFTTMAAPAAPVAGKASVYVDSTSRNLTIKNELGTVSHAVQTVACGAQFVNAINDAGVAACGTPAGGGNVSNSGTPTVNQLATWLNATTLQGVTTLPAATFPALTGDVTTPAGSLTTTLANVPSGTPHVGTALFTAIPAPGVPATGKAFVYVDSTSKNWAVKDDIGIIKHGVKTVACGSQFISAIADDGTPSCNTPAGGGNVSSTGTPAATQLALWTNPTTLQGVTVLPAANFPALTGDVITAAGGLATTIASGVVTLPKLANLATGTLLGRATAGTGVPEALTTLPTSTLPAFTGDVTSAVGTNVNTIPNGTVTSAKMASTIAAGTCTLCNLSFDLAGRITAAANGTGGSGGSGTVNTGTLAAGAFYPGAGTAVSPTTAFTFDATSILTEVEHCTHVSASFTLGVHNCVYVDTGSGGVIANLPPAASGVNARRYKVLKEAGTGVLTLAPNGAQTLNGAAASKTTTPLWSGFYIREQSATGWHVESLGVLGAADKVRTCLVTTGDPASGSPVLITGNNSPVSCTNDWGATFTIQTVACWGDAANAQINVITTGGTSTSVLSAPITCGTATWVAGTLTGTPVLNSFSGAGATCTTPPCSTDVQITNAGGVARYVAVKISGLLP